MKTTMNRGFAIVLHNQMAQMSFGHLEEEMLEAVMDNFVKLGKEAEHYHKMVSEMGKRLYEGIDKQVLEDFNAMAQKASEEELNAAFPEIFKLAKKQRSVEASLNAKEIEIELSPVDKKAFVVGVTKGNPRMTAAIFDLFTPMYKQEEKAQEDFSELDALMK